MIHFNSVPPDPDLIPALIGFLVGAAAAAGCWFALRGVFRSPMFLRKNFAGREVPVGAGVILAVATFAIWGVWRFVASVLSWNDPALASLAATTIVATGFGLLGLFDDLADAGNEQGFRGHVGAMLHGRLTTGGLKLVGGGLFAVAVVSPGVEPQVWWRLLLGAAVISLGANLGNLMDRAPARCTKVALACGVVLFATCAGFDQWNLIGPAVVLGGAAGLVFFDAREQLMLGDAGSNILGAALGWGLVVTTDWEAQVVVLVLLVGLNLASEKVSFSQVIEDSPTLRTLDRFGRRDPQG